MAIDDARALEVVRRQLDADAVAREDADPEAPHLARDVAEHLVPVVQLDPEHRVGQGLGDLALELDLLLLGHRAATLNPGEVGMEVLSVLLLRLAGRRAAL